MPSAFLSFILACNCYGNAASNSPYPPSSVITRLTWDRDVVKLKDGVGDNWPITWVDDDLQITSYGDGNGFSDRSPHLTLGFARVLGDPPNHYAEDLISDADTPMGGGPSGIKSSGMLMVDGLLQMLRVLKDRVPDRDRYEFFAGMDASGDPVWSPDIGERKPIFTDPNGTQRIAMTYNAALRRYILTASHRPPGSTATHTGALGVFDAPEPWGPWTTVYYDDNWSGDYRTYHHKFPTKWMSSDGRSMWLLFSGLDGGYYSFCVRKANLEF